MAGLSLNQDFFAVKTTKKCIHELAEAESLVLFVGSGLSASQGLPVWNQLLRRLLDRAAAEHPVLTDQAARAEFTRTLLQSTDPTILGSIIRTLYRGQETFYDIMKGAIYSDAASRTPRHASNFCRAVWELIFTRRECGLPTLIVTTNYDDVLEASVEADERLRSRMEAVHAYRAVAVCEHTDTIVDDCIAVHHIHGYIPAKEQERRHLDKIVLSVRDYGRNWESHWSHQLLAEHWESQWLFVGMSFHDPHISFFLTERHQRLQPEPGVEAIDDNPPIGVFSLQGQPWASLADNTRLALARAEVSRLREIGMFALPTLYFFQDAQFLREVALTMSPTAGNVDPYIDRRTSWAAEFAEKRISPDGHEHQRDLLEDIHKELVAIRTRLEELAAHEDERFKTELWCRDTEERALFQIGSSEFLPQDASRAPRYPLATDGPLAAVEAFTAGSRITRAVHESPAARWRHFLAVPMTLDGPPWFELPVGVLVVASSAPEGSSSLRTQRPTVDAQLAEWIEMMLPFLNPQLPLGIKGLISKILPA